MISTKIYKCKICGSILCVNKKELVSAIPKCAKCNCEMVDLDETFDMLEVNEENKDE